VDALGDWLIGPDYVFAPELAIIDGVPQARIVEFIMDSEDSAFYPGIERKVFGTVDPNNPRTLIVDSFSPPYTRLVTVYFPDQYVAGAAAPCIVYHDGPKEPGKAREHRLVRVLKNLIHQKRVPLMVAVLSRTAGAMRRVISVDWNTTPCQESWRSLSRWRCCRGWRWRPV
jgi:enterochelin esterase family protein